MRAFMWFHKPDATQVYLTLIRFNWHVKMDPSVRHKAHPGPANGAEHGRETDFFDRCFPTIPKVGSPRRATPCVTRSYVCDSPRRYRVATGAGRLNPERHVMLRGSLFVVSPCPMFATQSIPFR